MSKRPNRVGPETAPPVGNYLAAWREYRGLTQERLGEMVGASNSKISRIESGETELRPSFARKVAQLLGIPTIALYTINPHDHARTANLLDIWDRMSGEEQETALRMLSALVTRNNNSKPG